MFDTKNISNIVLLGKQSSGKTSIVESLLFVSGVIPQSEVERKNTVRTIILMNKKGASIQTAVMPLVHKDHKINIIDIPGNDDFISEISCDSVR